jgi:phosphopantothenoylcysteine decarboxylase / phosphopantothenate---cysteine ligase
VTLVQNPDIIADVARSPAAPLTIGFAAETNDTLENARQKRARKGLNLIVVNDVSDSRIGFNSEMNAVTLIGADGEMTLAMAPKEEIARQLMDRIADLYHSRGVGLAAARDLPLRALD